MVNRLKSRKEKIINHSEDGYVLLGIIGILAIVLISLLVMWKHNISEFIILEAEENNFEENLFIENQMTLLHKQMFEENYMVSKINNDEDLKETIYLDESRYGITGTYNYEYDDYSIVPTPKHVGKKDGVDQYYYTYDIFPKYTGIMRITGWEIYTNDYIQSTYSDGDLSDFIDFNKLNSSFRITLPEDTGIVVREIKEVEVLGNLTDLENNKLLIKERWVYK